MFINKLPDIIIYYRKYILVALLLLILIAISVLPRLKVVVDFNDYYPEGDPELSFFHDVQEELGSDEYIIMVAIEADESPFEAAFLKKINLLAGELRSIREIKRISEITSLKHFNKSPFGIISSNYIKPDSIYSSVELVNLARDSFYTKRFYNLSQNVIYLYAQLDENLTPDQLAATLDHLTSVIERNGLKQYHLIGRKYLEAEYKKIVSNELGQSIIYTLAVIILVLFFFFRSVKGVLFPVVSMMLALIMLYGCLALLGRPLNIMSNLFPTIILIVGISDIIHILSGYDLEYRKGLDTDMSTREVLYKIGQAIFLTSITTAIGFLTLCTSSMYAIRSFGIEAAIAVLIAFVFSILWAPLFIYQFKIRIPVYTGWKKFNWVLVSERINKIVNEKYNWIWLISALILLTSLFGISKLNFNNLQITNIPLNHRLKTDFNYFDELLGGSRTFELIVSADEEYGLRKIQNLRKLEQLHQHLESIPEINGIISPVSWYQLITRVYDNSLQFSDINDQRVLDRFVDRLPSGFYPKDWRLVSRDETIGRFSGRMEDSGRIKVNEINKTIYQWIENNDFPSELKFQISGTDHMIDKGHYHRIKNMIQGLILALLAVSIIIAFIFRNYRLLFISLIVNILPIIIVAGFMGYAGIEMRGSTTILFTIGFVIAVDDTLHFLSRYILSRKKGVSINRSVKKSILEAGRAIVTTSIILICGFLVLLNSQSWDVRVLGLLVSMMLFAALIVDLFLLPLLILKYDRKDEPQN